VPFATLPVPSPTQGASAEGGPDLPAWYAAAGTGLITLFAALGAVQHPAHHLSPLHLAAAAVIPLPYVIYRLGVPVPWFVYVAVTAGASFVVVGGNNDSVAIFALICLCAGMGMLGSLTESLATLAVCVAGLLGDAIAAAPPYRRGWVSWTLGCGFGWVAGWFGRRQQGLLAELRVAQAALAEQAANDERQRIAREIHDVIAHSLTVTMLHVTAARLAVEDDPEEARVALTEAERLGRQSLADIRRTVGLLRPRREQDMETQPLPAAGDVPMLVEDFCRTGLPVDLHLDGDLGAVSTTTGLALYRIVQESLTNVAKHAPGSGVTVELDVDPEQVHVIVRNRLTATPAGANGGGFGTVGMEERATLLGGTLWAGSDGDCWSVEATLPCGAGTAAPSPG
jgi:signal transduction histidine kinase